MSGALNPTPTYGLLASGFARMRLPEIRQAIVQDLQDRTGLVFETRPDSISGQLIDTFADREATLWELAEAVYLAMYPISAFGSNLDHSVAFAGVRRLFEEKSTVWATLFGVEGTVVTAGSIARHSASQQDFHLNVDAEITQEAAIDIILEVTTAVSGTEYWVQVEGATYRYTAAPGDTQTYIAAQLGILLVSTGLQIVVDAADIRMYAVEAVPFNVASSVDIDTVVIGSIGYFAAVTPGPLNVDAGMITKIVSTTTGWDSVYNIAPGGVGRSLETDDELRLRYNTGVFQLGAATLPSIKANLQANVPGLLALEVFENVNDVADSEGRVPHSIEVVAFGGDPQVIADQIWKVKAAGIDTNGTIIVNVTDSAGYQHPMQFNRPTPIYIWVKVVVDQYAEETFPSDGENQIQIVVTDTGNGFGIGKDVILQRLHGPIYDLVPGISKLTVTMAATASTTPPASGAYTANNIAIAGRELSQFDTSRITVTVNSLPRTPGAPLPRRRAR